MPTRDAARLAGQWTGAAAAILVFAVATRTIADPDLWGHLRFGLDTVHARAIGDVYPYAFTQDRPWINHEWLAEVQMALAHLAGGAAGLALLKGTIVFATLLVVWSGLRGVDVAVRLVTIGLMVVGTGSITTTLRPQLWSLLFLAMLCRTLVSDQSGRRRWLPGLFALWANVHGGWIVGLGVLCIWLGAEAWSHRDRLVERVVIALACLLATLITPYGTSLWRFLMETVRLTRDVTEWQPLWTLPPANWLPWVVALAAAVFMLSRPSAHRLPVAGVLGMLAYSSVRVSRIAPLFVVAAAVLLAPLFRRAGPAARNNLLEGVRHAPAALGVAALMLAAVGVWQASSSLRCIRVIGPWVPEPAAVRMLRDAPPGRLVSFFNWGEYAIWHLGPRIRVSFDGTRETVYSEERLAEHDAILAGRPDGIRALESWQAEYVWLPARSVATKDWLADNGYRIELDRQDSFVAVRNDLPPLTQPEEPLAGSRCFPD